MTCQHTPSGDCNLCNSVSFPSQNGSGNLHTETGSVSFEAPIHEESNKLTEVTPTRGPEIHSGQYLKTTQFPPLQYIVDGIIPEGVSTVIGPPKIKKSYFVYGIGLATAAGGVALGCIPVKQRPTLYLALEDGHRRLKDRAIQLLGSADDIPEGFQYVLQVQPGQQASDLIRSWLNSLGSDANRAFIIVDTAQKVRTPSSANANAYQEDYRFGSVLKSIAGKYPGLALVIVHHTRKMQTADFVESSSGSNGLAGAVDSIIALQRERHSNEAKLQVTGRDVIEGAYLIEWTDRGWVLSGDSLTESSERLQRSQAEHALADTTVEVLEFVRANPDCTPKQVELGTSVGNQAGVYLKRLLDADRIVKSKRGHYRVPPPALTEIGPCQSCGESMTRYGDASEGHVCDQCQPNNNERK